VFRKRPDGSYASTLLEELAWVRHGFGTRRFPDGLQVHPVAALRQVHSARTLVVESVNGFAGEGDALISATPGQYLSIRTADCVPVLIAAPDRRVIAAAHAGWRGTAARILRRTVELLVREWDVDPRQIVAAIGPGIGPCCYEVGAEVAALFEESVRRPSTGGKVFLDLIEANRRELLETGVRPGQIDVANLCTRCCCAEFFSYRAQPGETGRMRNVIGIRAGRRL